MHLTSPAALVTRSVRRVPVSISLMAVMLLIAAFSSALDDFCIDSSLVDLYPWRFVTYPLATLYRQLWRVLINGMVILAGIFVEANTGSSEYLVFLLFTTITTGVVVLVLNLLICQPLQSLFYGNDWGTSLGNGYTGIWPIAEVIAFSFCRIRGVSTALRPRFLKRPLLLQQIPFTVVWAALLLDLLQLLFGSAQLEGYEKHREGWAVLMATPSLLVSWLYERHVVGAADADFALDAFVYPSRLRNYVRRGGAVFHAWLRTSRLRFLLPSEEGSNAGMPMPVFSPSSASGGGAVLRTAAATILLPGTTVEEAERHRLIAREALARRLQQAQPLTRAVTTEAETTASADKTA